MRKKYVGIVVAATLLVASVVGVLVFINSQEPVQPSAGIAGTYYGQAALDCWYRPAEKAQSVQAQQILLDGQPEEAFPITLQKGQCLTVSFTPEQSGNYQLVPTYKPVGEVMVSDAIYTVSLDGGKSTTAQLYFPWYDTLRGEINKQGNEVTPKQEAFTEEVISPFLDNTNISKSTLNWELEQGSVYTFHITPDEQEICIVDLCLFGRGEKLAQAETVDDVPTIIVEAEDYSLKSDSYNVPSSEKNAALYPYDSYYKRLNVLNIGTSAAQKVLWEFEVQTEGNYRLAFRCSQNANVSKRVYALLEIDGQEVETQSGYVSIDYTGSNGYSNVYLKADGEDVIVHLTAGVHTISVASTLGEYEEIYYKIFSLMNEVNEFGLSLIKLTGGVDTGNRTWNLDEYMPDAVPKIQEFAQRIDDIYAQLEQLEGKEPVYASDLNMASGKLRKLLKEPERIPGKTEEICRGDDSAAKYLGNVLGTLTSTSFTADRLYICGQEELPKASSGFFVTLLEEVKRFLWSFSDAATAGSISDKSDDDELQVWVGQPAYIVDILQQLLDETYNQENGTNIRLIVMPDEQKLVLSNATGSNPDVVIAASSGLPFTFASRGALKNLLDYEDFAAFYGQDYRAEALVPMCYGDGIYGAVDSQNFQLLFYRKDILEVLGLDVPQSWSDVRAMMPTLLRNQMNFYIPVSSSAALKSLAVTTPFIYQHGGELYDIDGGSTAIDSAEVVEAMTELTDFYRIYAMQKTVENFFLSFRYGEVPIGIGDFNTYCQLVMAAPELADKWGVALCPGNELEDGTVLRYQTASATASMIFGNTDKPEEAWDFLKWWLSEETQYEFSVRRISTLGISYQWNTANLSAFEALPFDSTVKKMVLEQWESQREITPHPAAYIVERELSGVWNEVVVDNGSLVEALDQAVLLSDREIIRKLQEFGYVDENGNMIYDYNINVRKMLAEVFQESR